MYTCKYWANFTPVDFTTPRFHLDLLILLASARRQSAAAAVHPTLPCNIFEPALKLQLTPSSQLQNYKHAYGEGEKKPRARAPMPIFLKRGQVGRSPIERSVFKKLFFVNFEVTYKILFLLISSLLSWCFRVIHKEKFYLIYELSWCRSLSLQVALCSFRAPPFSLFS